MQSGKTYNPLQPEFSIEKSEGVEVGNNDSTASKASTNLEFAKVIAANREHKIWKLHRNSHASKSKSRVNRVKFALGGGYMGRIEKCTSTSFFCVSVIGANLNF